MKIILLTGVIGSGKDHYAECYKAAHPDESVAIVHLAEPLREIVENMFDVDDYTKWKSVSKNRKLMVDLGQSIKKVFGQDFFMRRIVDAYNLELAVWFDRTLIIPDFRFPVEIKSLIERTLINPRKVSVVFCDYHSDRYESRPEQESEKMALWLRERLKDGQEMLGDEFLKLISEYEGNV